MLAPVNLPGMYNAVEHATARGIPLDRLRCAASIACEIADRVTRFVAVDRDGQLPAAALDKFWLSLEQAQKHPLEALAMDESNA